MLKNTTLVLVALLYSLCAFAGGYVEETKTHYRIVVPFNALNSDEKIRLIEQTRGMLLDELARLLPENVLSRDTLKQMKAKKTDYAELTQDLQDYMNDDLPGSFAPVELIPTGFMLLAGGKVSLNVKVGGGASGTLVVVVVPVKVRSINKITREENIYWQLRAAVAAMPMINVGIGAGGGAAGRAGFGLVWGELPDPADFYGTVVAVSGTATLGAGVNLKGGVVMGLSPHPKNFFATAMWEFGAKAEASPLHINIGPLLPITQFIRYVEMQVQESNEAENKTENLEIVVDEE